eukprot:3511034-Pyramimonas_sp.AAC.1
MGEMIQSDRPEVILMTPPRRGVSVARIPNWERLNPANRGRVEQGGIFFWRLATQVAMHQISEGRKFLIENPSGAFSRQLKSTEVLLSGRPKWVPKERAQCPTAVPSF